MDYNLKYQEKLYRVYETINKLLYNRGYNKAPELSFEEFCNVPKNLLTIRTDRRVFDSTKNNSIFVFFPEEEKGVKVGVKPIRTYKNEMLEANIKNAIIIVRDGITSFAKNSIQTDLRSDDPFIIEIFTESELLIDITEHISVPKHELLSYEEKQDLLKKLDIKESQLPKMVITDPISRYYGLNKKDVVRITRISETAGIYFNYRIVI